MLKSIPAENYMIRPFVTHKRQSYIYLSGSTTNPPEITIDLAIAPSSGWSFSPSTDIQNPDGIYQSTLYRSVEHLFYTSASVLPFTNSQSVVPMNFSAGGSAHRKFAPTSSFYVINIAQPAYGEGIRPGSVSITNSNNIIVDDGQGRLVLSGSNSSMIVGNIFYNLGVAVINAGLCNYVYYYPSADWDLITNHSTWAPTPVYQTLASGSVISEQKSGSFNGSAVLQLTSTDPSIPINAHTSQSIIFNATGQGGTSGSTGNLLFLGYAIDPAFFNNSILAFESSEISITNSPNLLPYNLPMSGSGGAGGIFSTASYSSSMRLQFLMDTVPTGSFTSMSGLFIQVPLTASVAQMLPSNLNISIPSNFIATGITLASPLSISFDATQTIYEHRIIATIDPYEFNFSTNVSSQTTASSGERIPDLFLSGNMSPYVTTVGLYNSAQELVAVAKYNQPIKRIPGSQQSFIIRFDA